MKKEALIISFLFLITLATATPQLNLNKETFQPGETLLGEIITSGLFDEKISTTQIQFFEGKKQVPIEYDITFYNNKHYIYTYLTREGNFTIKINNILYKENNQLKEKSIIKNISVNQQFVDDNKTQTAILSIKPGFIFTTKTPKLAIENKGNTNLEISYLESQITLSPTQTKIITNLSNQTFSKLKITSYEEFEIPIIYISLEQKNQTTSPKIISYLKTNPPYIHVNTVPNSQSNQQIELINLGTTNITNITIFSNLQFLTFQQINAIPAKSIQNITLTFLPTQEGFFSQPIVVQYTQNNTIKNISIPINVYSFPEGTNLDDIEESSQTCEELDGIVCINQKCSSTPVLTFGGEYCCRGQCETIEPPKEPFNWTWVIALVLILALGIAGYFIYKK